MQVKIEITDLFGKFWVKLYIAENLPLIRKNKRHVVSLHYIKHFFNATNGSCQRSVKIVLLTQLNNKFADKMFTF